MTGGTGTAGEEDLAGNVRTVEDLAGDVRSVEDLAGDVRSVEDLANEDGSRDLAGKNHDDFAQTPCQHEVYKSKGLLNIFQA